MKKLSYYLLILMSCIAISCSKENFNDSTPETAEKPDSDTTPDPTPNTITTPCDFDLSNVAPNSTIILNCILDLNGETITLPENVNFEFEGGDILNGKLIFNGGLIAGELLSSKLEVEGNVQLEEPTFKFYASRWDQIEEVKNSSNPIPPSKSVALKNNTELEKLIFWTKELGATTFEIGKFDAYFEVATVTSTTSNQNFYPHLEAINVPSDFHLKMSDKTVLRVFPTEGRIAASLLAVHEASNVIISGGTLYGDRDLRKYASENEESGTHLCKIRSGNNVVVDNVKFTMGSVGGVDINSTGFSFNPDYNPTRNVIIKNCTFDKVRMMSIALTDGRDIRIENNTFIDTALPTANSDGGVVGFAINIEPVRSRDTTTGELINYQVVQDVVVTGNKETGSRRGAFNVFIGNRIVLENNTLENKISWSLASNTKIRNNTFIASEKSKNFPAIDAGGTGDTVFDNEISGNKISGYGVAISAYFGEVSIYKNKLTNNTNGIQLKEIEKETVVYENLITSDLSSSRGISIQSTFANNVTIHSHNTTNYHIDVKANHLYFVAVNQEAGQENYKINVNNNDFDSSASVVFSKTKGVTYNNNMSKGPILLANASKVDLASNSISTANSHGVSLTGVNTAIKASQNTIDFPENPRYECINIDASTNSSEVTLNGNICN
ncbi:hypothetical protein [Aquimarina aquimarini]|uniref:hypothetical protein n=1 Tax=Aquimarina aquimarini TaxID=1191734 RepID=UPI000D55C4A4|nr:hypothetical protein [Aquimarina aquimarini]